MCICSDAGGSTYQPLSDSKPSYLAPELNSGGALDVIVVSQADGNLRATELFVVFDSLSAPEMVSVAINGETLEMGEHKLQATAAAEPALFAAGQSAVPPPELLSRLQKSCLLRHGRNEICYSIGGARARQSVRAFLYVWAASQPAVVFDVDGTITQSDLAGQLANLIDGSPTHDGICELLCQLHARGYLIMYLTSRPLLGPAGIERTRRFLFQVAVDAQSGYRMPPAPVLTTTHVSTWQALASELSGGSKAFKSTALQTVRDAFQATEDAAANAATTTAATIAATIANFAGRSAQGVSGLYAGFGNREKDALAYLSAGIPPERIFIIDTSSLLVGRSALLPPSTPTDQPTSKDAPKQRSDGSSGTSRGLLAAQPTWKSYRGMLAVVDQLFPRQTWVTDAALVQAIDHFAGLAATHRAMQADSAKRPLW